MKVRQQIAKAAKNILGRASLIVPLMAILLLCFLAQHSLAGYYYLKLTDGNWTDCIHYCDSSGPAAACTTFCDKYYGIMRLFAAAADESYAAAKCETWVDFQYVGETRYNMFNIGYHTHGEKHTIDDCCSLIVGAKLFMVINIKESLDTMISIHQSCAVNSNWDAKGNPGSINFGCKLWHDSTYRVVLAAKARCGADSGVDAGYIDYYRNVIDTQYFIDLDSILIYHYDDSTYTYNDDGDSSGSHCHETYHYKQSKYEDAKGFNFKISNSDDNCYMDTWYVIVTDFDSSTSNRQGNARAGIHTGATDEAHYVPRDHWVRVEASQWISSHCACRNTMCTKNRHWIEAVKGTDQIDTTSIIPEYEWKIYPPVYIGDSCIHVFTLANLDTLDQRDIKVEGLSFYMGEDTIRIHTLDSMSFGIPVEGFTLSPYGTFYDTIITSGPQYGKYIYFKYSISDPLITMDTLRIFHTWAAHEIYLGCSGICGDANDDATVNVADAVWVINYVFAGGDPPEPVLACGNANNDASVNVADAVWIINFVFAGGDPPGDCGPGNWDDQGGDCCPFEP